MADLAKVVIIFNDGTTHEVLPGEASSIFLNEDAAKKCGHKKPWKDPPKKNGSTTYAALSTASSTGTTGTGGTSTTGTTCYYINGMVICD
jgi:hypothetical protein